MRALMIASALLLTATAEADYPRTISPDGRFEAYTTANSPDGYGMKVFLRRAQAGGTGSLLCQNGRWIDAKWSPDSRFLAVVDHPDGHIADVYVFGVTAADAAAPRTAILFYHTPNPMTYDVKWDVIGWHSKLREIVLKQEVRDQNAGTHATHTLTAKIGTQPLKNELLK